MNVNIIKQIIDDELALAKKRILDRLSALETGEEGIKPSKPLPKNKNYETAWKLYRQGASHSEVSRELGTPMNNTKRYYNWLVIHGYLTAKPQALSEREKQVVQCLYEEGLSVTETARKLGISAPNVVQRRDNALRKGYTPPEKKSGRSGRQAAPKA